MILLVSYDLRKLGQDYTGLHKAIMNLGGWWHYLDSTWLLDTHLTSDQVAKTLMAHIDANDSLLVIKIEPRTAQGYLPNKAWEWINSRLAA